MGVHYELYIDSFFLLNFCMDIMLLMLVKRVLGCTATYRSILLGALFGAVASCFLTVAARIPVLLRITAGYGLVSICMVKLCFRKMNLRMVLKATIELYLGAILMGGFLELLALQIHFFRKSGFNICMVLAAGLGMYLLVCMIYRGAGDRKHIFTVQLNYLGKSVTLKALYDTGNSLSDPTDGAAVALVEREAVSELLKSKRDEDYRVIPYHSVGNPHGILEGYRLTEAVIFGENEKKYVERPLVALTDEKLSSQSAYRMILHSTWIK